MKLHKVLFWFLIFLLPTQLGKHFWPDSSFVLGIRVDYLSPTIYLTDILVVLILGLWGWKKKKFTIKKFWWVPVILFYLLTNALFAQNPEVALYKLVKIIELALLGVYVSRNFFVSRITYHVLPLVVIYSSLIAIFQFLKQASLGGILWWLGERTFNIQTPGIALGEVAGRLFLRPYATFSHPNSLAGFILVCLILTFPYWFQKNKRFSIFYFLFSIFTIVLSFSRAVWLVGLLISAWYIAHYIWKKPKLVLATCFLLLIVFWGIGPSWFNEKPVQERIQLTRSSWLMFKASPLFGVGLNNFVARLPEFWPTTNLRFLQPVHNIFLLILAETGLAGFLIFLWFLILTYKRLLLIANYQLLITLSVILALGFFDHYWLTLQQNQLLFTLVLGLSWSKTKSDLVK